MTQTRRRFLGTGILASIATVLAGCQGGSDGGDDSDGSDGSDGTDGGSASTETDAGTTGDAGGASRVTVDMTGSQFDPRNLEIDAGTTVVWANRDSSGHTVTNASDNWSFDREVAGGDSTRYTFDSDGVYDVFCRFHGAEDLSGMSMKIAVGDTAIESPLGGSGSAGDGAGTTRSGDETTTDEGGGGGGPY